MMFFAMQKLTSLFFTACLVYPLCLTVKASGLNCYVCMEVNFDGYVGEKFSCFIKGLNH